MVASALPPLLNHLPLPPTPPIPALQPCTHPYAPPHKHTHTHTLLIIRTANVHVRLHRSVTCCLPSAWCHPAGVIIGRSRRRVSTLVPGHSSLYGCTRARPPATSCKRHSLGHSSPGGRTSCTRRQHTHITFPLPSPPPFSRPSLSLPPCRSLVLTGAHGGAGARERHGGGADVDPGGTGALLGRLVGCRPGSAGVPLWLGVYLHRHLLLGVLSSRPFSHAFLLT